MANSAFLPATTPAMTEELPPPDFEIDHRDEFAQFFLNDRSEIVFYLNLLARRRSLLTAYTNGGERFFLTSIVAVDEATGRFFLDPPQAPESLAEAGQARQITLVTNLDRVKIQIRLSALMAGSHQNQNVLVSAIPEVVLRLQRREFFRLELPTASPIQCKLAAPSADGTTRIFELALSDISGGGISLIAPTEIAEFFPRDALFPQCRLEISEDGVIQVNLCVRKTVEISAASGLHSLRIGCEFVNLPSSNQSFIERYIARIERERKAKDSGLVA